MPGCRDPGIPGGRHTGPSATATHGADLLLRGTGFAHRSGGQLLRAVSFIREALPAAEARAVPTAGEGLLGRSPEPGRAPG